jgi:glycosyltransferase involved in cell wall biosynthesis
MPIYNGAQYVARTIESILSQSLRDLELVISDNASTDATESICRAYAAADSRVRYHRQPLNRGAAWNYNEVFHRATGLYFKWAAADDLLLPELVERCVEILDREHDVVVCFPRTLIIDEHDRPVRSYDDGVHLDSAEPDERYRLLFRVLGECNAVFGVIRSDVLRRTKLIGSFIGADNCLLGELSLHGRFVQVPEELFHRRDHPKASSRNKTPTVEMQFYDPRRRRQVIMPAWRALIEDLRSILRGPVKITVKLRLWLFILWAALRSRHELFEELAEVVTRRPGRGR